MKELFEYSDTLNLPFEAFPYDTQIQMFPIEAHWHYFVEIIWVTEGTVLTTCDSKIYPLTSGQMILFQPRTIHAFHTRPGEHAKYIVLKFDIHKLSLIDSYMPKFTSIFTGASKDNALPIIFTQDNFPNLDVNLFFDRCIKEAQNKEYGYDTYLMCEFSILLLEVLRIWRIHGFNPDSSVYAEDTMGIHNILEYIDQHSHENIQVEDLAAMCHMSYSYFAKMFHKLYGQSCKKYIEFIRLSKVENYLLFTDQPLNFISNETGFSDCSHMIRVFKQKYGITPKQFRMQYQKQN